VIMGFPSLEFGRQEFDDDAKVAEFAKAQNFPGILMKIGKVTGSDATEVWKYMKAESGAKDPTWNFNGKFLVSKTGAVTMTTRGTLERDIAELMDE
jgi:glutathione peroxidase-family protein